MKKRFKSISLADQVFDKLEDDIILGVYPRGQILTELGLAEELGVSRTPIREALRRLEQERLIADNGKGSVVLGITEDDLLDIMNIRERIEGLAAYYAAKNITPEAVQELEHLIDLQDFYFSKHDVEQLRYVDDDFHDAISHLSGRMVICDTLIPLHRKTRRYRRLVMGDWDRAAQITKEHRAIAQAIAEGNGDLAQELMTRHIVHSKEQLIKEEV